MQEKVGCVLTIDWSEKGKVINKKGDNSRAET
jgi:hypothetical protein